MERGWLRLVTTNDRAVWTVAMVLPILDPAPAIFSEPPVMISVPAACRTSTSIS
jgi:hypothetical protein